MKKVKKPTRQELEEAYRARLESETRQPETEEQRRLAAERKKKLKETVRMLQQQE